jgi:hypothetical protein
MISYTALAVLIYGAGVMGSLLLFIWLWSDND